MKNTHAQHPVPQPADTAMVPLRRSALAAAILSALHPGSTAFAADSAGSSALEEIVVTASKRAMDMQDLPQSIQAFTTDEIEKLGFNNMDDYLKAIPSMSSVSTSPGRNEVVFRGVSTGTGEWRIDSGTAVYLDELPKTSATQAVDPRMVDIQRVEALPGPQGTLFGSSSQSAPRPPAP